MIFYASWEKAATIAYSEALYDMCLVKYLVKYVPYVAIWNWFQNTTPIILPIR